MGRNHLGDLEVDGTIILKKDLKEIESDVQDKFQCPVLMNTAMNLGVPYEEGNFWTRLATNSFSRRAKPQNVTPFISVYP
jgi:hypothetical protein